MTDRFADTCNVLVIGYGSELRRDDAVGPRVAGIVEQMNLPGVRSMACQQLTPELADPISRAELVVFVDADSSGGADVELRTIAAAASGSADAHASDPGSVLALARDLFGRCPPARLLAIPVEDFGLGEGISPTARRGIERAVELIQSLAGA